MTDRLVELAADTVKAAMAAGADAAEALVADGFVAQVDVRDGQVEKLEQADGREIGIRVFVGKSSAMISGSVLTKDSIARLIETALNVARLAPPDPFSGIAAPELLAKTFPALDMVSAELPDAARLQRMAREVEAAALAVPGVTKSSGAGAAASSNAIALATSNGFAQGYRRTNISMSAAVIAGEGTSMERDYDYSSAIHFSDLRTPEEVGREAGQRAVRRLNPRKVKSQQVPVVFDRRVSASLIGHLLGAINGSAIARGTSFLKDKLGERIFSDAITIVDDPFIVRGHGSRPFDAEGLAPEKRNLIDRGVLTGWLLDLRSARQLGLKPTGQASRGLNGPPSPSSSNVHILPGISTQPQLLQEIGTGLLVTEMIGSSVNMVTGDYSRGASGFWIENGELTYPVSEITVAGNLKDMFLNVTPANDLLFRSSVNAPSCAVEGLTIAGT